MKRFDLAFCSLALALGVVPLAAQTPEELGGQTEAISTFCRSEPARGLGARGNPTGQPLGGGDGYTNHVAIPAAVVTDSDGLVRDLAAARPGTVVYVDDNAEINLSGQTIPIGPGVTLASGRGRNGSLGGLLYTDAPGTSPLFLVNGDNVRITGLRIRGPRLDVLPPLSNPEGHDNVGIRVTRDAFEIDNVDIWRFARTAIQLDPLPIVEEATAHVHHNFIHDTSRQRYFYNCRQDVFRCGLSYGVSVGPLAETLIEANVFDHHRHAINGGDENTNYEARYNLVLPNFYGHPFDMHGAGDFCPYDPEQECSTDCLWEDPKCPGWVAGHKIEIHENTFLNVRDPNPNNPGRRPPRYPSVKIRARPQDSAYIYCNHFRLPVADALAQTGVPSEYAGTPSAGFTAWDNRGSSLVEPYITIRSTTGRYLGVNATTGAVGLFASTWSSGTRWRLAPDDDVIRLQSLVSGQHYGRYLDISTTSGAVKLYSLESHTGTKWSKDENRLMSKSSGAFNGQYLSVDIRNGDLEMYWNRNYRGTRWTFTTR